MKPTKKQNSKKTKTNKGKTSKKTSTTSLNKVVKLMVENNKANEVAVKLVDAKIVSKAASSTSALPTTDTNNKPNVEAAVKAPAKKGVKPETKPKAHAAKVAEPKQKKSAKAKTVAAKAETAAPVTAATKAVAAAATVKAVAPVSADKSAAAGPINKAASKPAAKTAASKSVKKGTAKTVAAPNRMKKQLRGKNVKRKKAVLQRFIIDCSSICNDLLMDMNDFEKYMRTHIKVNNKVNNLDQNVTLERDNHMLIINCNVRFSKRYFKYLSKRYLKKNSLRDWVHVISMSKELYALHYFKIQDNM